jgi:glycosyltransferase involved in cell wall biosynthesis
VTDTVLVAYLHPNVVSHSFSDSLMRLFAYDIQHEARVARGGGPMMFRCGPGGLVEARNDVVRHFLDEFDADWLWFVDSDMGFAPDTVDRLVAVADPVQRPVVGALCFGMRETAPDGLNGWQTTPFPTLYDWAKKPDGETGFLVRRTYPVNSVVQVAGTGAACLLIHRSILARIRDEFGDVWFDRSRYPSGTPIAEDLSFCARVNQLGAPVMVCTGVRTNHHKQVWLGEDYYWRTVTPPPATERTAVIVPVMQRPQNAKPFMESLRASTGLATVYVLADAGDVDTKEAWRAAGADEVRTGTHETFAKKVNEGYRISSEPWLFLAGDDVRFHAGWLDYAQAVANDHPFIDVVGTNDLANPRVLSGQHATHMLIRRSYIDEQGASWDGPKTVCHEGYRHWYVDNEIVAAAQQRQVWAMALGSRVEHRHPLFGTADNDTVYELGQSHQKQDYALWRQRLATHAPEAAGA